MSVNSVKSESGSGLGAKGCGETLVNVLKHAFFERVAPALA